MYVLAVPLVQKSSVLDHPALDECVLYICTHLTIAVTKTITAHSTDTIVLDRSAVKTTLCPRY